MQTEHGRATPGWLALREPADAAARAPELVAEVRAQVREQLQAHRPAHGVSVVHDLGCGTGSMARWLAPRLDGPQHWVLHDRDPELLGIAAREAPTRAADGAPVTVETRLDDITRLGDLTRWSHTTGPATHAVGPPSLVTASALLDMLTADELDSFVATCVAAGCPALVALSVTGQVDLEPSDPFDARVADSFNDHQRRSVAGHRLLGPDAVDAAVDAFRRHGADVLVRPSPWRLGPGQRELEAQWFNGWFGAACEQSPDLAARAGSYPQRRLADAAAGRLRVTVHHRDLWVRP